MTYKIEWDNDVAKECGLSLPFSPTVNEAGTVIGNVTKECAALTGLCEGIPVVAGGGDAQMASLGTGVVKPNQTLICGGSFGNKKRMLLSQYQIHKLRFV